MRIPRPGRSHSVAELELFDALIEHGVISEGRLYRARLFSFDERASIALALRMPDGYSRAEGTGGFAEEMAMVNYQAHGKKAKDIQPWRVS